MTTTTQFEAGHKITGTPFSPTRETIRAFCEASLDFNPLHLDDEYMKGDFGKTNFGGIIMHGMNNFGVITKMLTDWIYAHGGVQRRLETRWKMPVKPGDTITPSAVVKAGKDTQTGRWFMLDVQVQNQRGEVVAVGEAMVEIPLAS
ncbi:MAG: MaoC family dehydratase [Pseudoxanthomonas sp.]|uniref:MaoC family dehydratase n=1 Tax=Hydrogenophaga sp. TaxID=1904254 RepID=UPI00083116CC|nr:MaoC family dehydratase [Hydrogenophaga sp.]MBP7598297.1 MaoC family dehydratase [Pseudoxanthomonas sp.]MCA0440785.1 MaoC family dehydratase [Pseudomonadota bacterium]MCC7225331.1 MaoC family dehydratase [Burkholderiaceae bacterium]MBP7657093.1 MaoC family dehydratase [Pseudoxanthomonas sp.]MCW5652493.1 MaoC family dehydratase [Hydrogenophaga sp.]